MFETVRFIGKYGIHRIKGVKGAAEYYQKVGDDVVPTLNENFIDKKKPLWLNLGYWKSARTYKEACEDMAREVAYAGGFSENDEILDVGFGYGEQDLLWAKENNVKKITGINITPLHVEVASNRKEETPYKNQINYQLGNAVKMEFENSCFDKVVALESAFNFRPRQQFFLESYRVLKKDGILVIADMVKLKEEKSNKFMQRKGRKEIYIPDENVIDKEEYVEQLKKVGFSFVKVRSIAKYVYPGARKYFYLRAAGGSVYTEIELTEKDFLSNKGAKVWGRAYGLSDYVIIVAKK